MKKRALLFSILLSVMLVMVLSAVSVSASAEGTAFTARDAIAITTAEITITPPKPETLSTDFPSVRQITVPADANYTVEASCWYHENGTWSEIADLETYFFLSDHTYKLWVTLKANEGYVFDPGATVAITGGTIVGEPESYTSPDQSYSGLVVSASVTIEKGGKCGDNLTWKEDDDGLLTISGTGKMYTYEEFYYRAPWSHDITRVVIEEGLTEIGMNAFYGCTKMASITLPHTLTKINAFSFTMCTALTEIAIPDSVTYIGAGAFQYCHGLTQVTIPDSVTELGYQAFYYCENLVSASFPDGMDTISWGIFMDCGQLADITIPKSVHYISKSVFDGCASLKNVYYGGTKTDRDHITIEDKNDYLKKAEWHCKPDIAEAKVKAVEDQVYTGKAITPAITAKFKGKSLSAGTDYTTRYQNNKNIGEATILLTGIGEYAGTKEITFNIVPKAVSLSSLKAGENTLTVKWKKGSKINGYELEYSTKKNFKKAKKINITKAGKTSTVIEELASGKTFYVRIRAYKTVKGTKYYSAWSKVKKANVK